MLATLGLVFVVSGLLGILIPVAVGFSMIRRFGTSWRSLVFGALMFLVSLISNPIHRYASQLILSSAFTPIIVSLMTLVPPLILGISEETARYAGFKLLVKDPSFGEGLTYGAGHGGIESLLLVGFNVLMIGVLLLTNPEALPPDQLLQILGIPIYQPLLWIYESIMKMIVHIGLSIVVLESIRRPDKRYLLAAIGIHTLLNFLSISSAGKGIIISEMTVTGFAIGLAYWTYNQFNFGSKKIGSQS